MSRMVTVALVIVPRMPPLAALVRATVKVSLPSMLVSLLIGITNVRLSTPGPNVTVALVTVKSLVSVVPTALW